MPRAISASEALRLLLESGGSVRALDVRSEGEFAQASVPGFVNVPILTNEERHLVGISYKEHGQQAAIALGEQLVLPTKTARVDAWKAALAQAEFPLVTCFRGGMRSEIACDWLEAAGVRTMRVEGGYKALRQQLNSALDAVPELLVIAGATGSGKSRLLREAKAPHLDLELHANHRGSAFGGSLTSAQPQQATFENKIGFELMRLSSPILIEDESAMVGKICLPESLRKKIASSRVIRITMSQEERALHLYHEYVSEPLSQGVAPAVLRHHYAQALRNIGRKLGGAAEAELQGKLEIAFSAGERELHLSWILSLLTLYYDKAYEYSFQKIPRETAFEGDWASCKQWIQEKFC